MKAFIFTLTLLSLSAFAQEAFNAGSSTGNATTDVVLSQTQCLAGTGQERVKLEFEREAGDKDPAPNASLISYGRSSMGDVIVVEKHLEIKKIKFTMYLCKDQLTSMANNIAALQVLGIINNDFAGNVWIGTKDNPQANIRVSFYPSAAFIGSTQTDDQKIKDNELVKEKVDKSEIGRHGLGSKSN